MIVRMKKVTLLVSERDRREALLDLRKLGVVHIKSLQVPESAAIDRALHLIEDCQKAVDISLSYETGAEAKKFNLNIEEIPHAVKNILEARKRIDDLEQNLNQVNKDLDWYKNWGAFDPEHLRELKQKGISIQLYAIPKSAFKKIKDKKRLRVISQGPSEVYAALISHKEEALDFEPVKIPQQSFDALEKQRKKMIEEIEVCNAHLRSFAGARHSMEEFIEQLIDKNKFLSVLHGMKSEENFAYLQGYCPASKVSGLTALAKCRQMGYLIEEPTEKDDVPTLIENPKWIKIIQPVFKFMNTVPGYREADISVIFLLFFSLFFAMLIGDAGYGLIFAVAAFLIRKKAKNAPAEIFRLIYTLSFTTIAWGTLTGTWFGAERIAQISFLAWPVVSRIDSFVSGNQDFMIYFCFIIGVIHLSIAHIILAVRKINSLIALSEVGWVGILWGLFYVAGNLVLGKNLPFFASYLLIIGVLLVVFFSSPQKNLVKGALSSLGNVPLKIISSFADVVSYLRLFAVGYASVVLAATFNDMALQLGFNNLFTTLGSSVILVLGHTLNIILGLMAVIVHGVRLNMLEFSGQMGMEWSGKEYQPFK